MVVVNLHSICKKFPKASALALAAFLLSPKTRAVLFNTVATAYMSISIQI